MTTTTVIAHPERVSACDVTLVLAPTDIDAPTLSEHWTVTVTHPIGVRHRYVYDYDTHALALAAYNLAVTSFTDTFRRCFDRITPVITVTN